MFGNDDDESCFMPLIVSAAVTFLMAGSIEAKVKQVLILVSVTPYITAIIPFSSTSWLLFLALIPTVLPDSASSLLFAVHFYITVQFDQSIQECDENSIERISKECTKVGSLYVNQAFRHHKTTGRSHVVIFHLPRMLLQHDYKSLMLFGIV